MTRSPRRVPRRPWEDLLRKNSREKAIALVLSIALWVVVVHRSQPVHQTFTVPVQYGLLGPGLVVTRIEPAAVRVVVGQLVIRAQGSASADRRVQEPHEPPGPGLVGRVQVQARRAAGTSPASPLLSSSSTRRHAASVTSRRRLVRGSATQRSNSAAPDTWNPGTRSPPQAVPLPPPVFGEQAPHVERIAADRTQLESHVPLAAGNERSLAERLAQAIERVAQRVPRGLVICLGPQEGHQAFPRLGSRGFRQGEVEQQRQAFGLGERSDRSAVRRPNLERAEESKFDHAVGRDPGDARVNGRYGDRTRTPQSYTRPWQLIRAARSTPSVGRIMRQVPLWYGLGLVVAGCGSGDGTGPMLTNAVSTASGNGQAGAVATALPLPLRVLVDSAGTNRG